MRAAGMHRELCEGIRPATDDDSGVVRRPLVAKVRPKLFPSMPPPRSLAGPVREVKSAKS